MSAVDPRSQAVIDALEQIDPEFVLHLPSSTLKDVLEHFLGGDGAKPHRRVFPIPREEEGISILAGLSLARRRAVMIFQDNGIGNLLTSLLTFPQPYHLPVFGIVTRRGGRAPHPTRHTHAGRRVGDIHRARPRVLPHDSSSGVRAREPDGRLRQCCNDPMGSGSSPIASHRIR